ncbi:MAG: hypothetical protein AAGI01_13730, partial [Myxococcota bacterium]
CCIRHMHLAEPLLSAASDTCTPADDCFLLHPAHAPLPTTAVCDSRHMRTAEPLLSAAADICAAPNCCCLLHPRHALRRAAAFCSR